jgi:hypothetical protein
MVILIHMSYNMWSPALEKYGLGRSWAGFIHASQKPTTLIMTFNSAWLFMTVKSNISMFFGTVEFHEQHFVRCSLTYLIESVIHMVCIQLSI